MIGQMDGWMIGQMDEMMLHVTTSFTILAQAKNGDKLFWEEKNAM
jgi:hypothetical protein